MKKGTKFIGDMKQLMETISYFLEVETDSNVLVSGTFDSQVHKSILDKILNSSSAKNCKVIIPYVTSNGGISRTYINKLSTMGGQARVNSQFKKNLIIIGRYAFILSFSSKYSRTNGIKTNFECCMLTDDADAVQYMQEVFLSKWQDSLPLSANEA